LEVAVPDASKQQVKDFWNNAACGEDLYLSGIDCAAYAQQACKRYALEPFIEHFARFEDSRDWDVLEIGVGLGADHQRFAEAGARLTGIDLTDRAVEHTRRRLALFGLKSDLRVADAESLPCADESFDLVYSWGVLHHTPYTARAIAEIWRVLRLGGVCKVMIYHRYSLVGFMLWLRYALLVGRPFTSLDTIYAKYLESPGTKAFSEAEARGMFAKFRDVSIAIQLSHGDLLSSNAGQRHRGPLLTVARLLWPRWLLRKVCRRNGLFMMVQASKT
jgi:SAM-dependent methyltransferase